MDSDSEDVQQGLRQHIEAAANGKVAESKSYSLRTEDNRELHVTVSGRGPLIVVQSPGWGLGVKYLTQSLTALEQHFTLCYLLARGTLPSSRPDPLDCPIAMSSRNMSTDIEFLRKQLGLDKLTVLGHSNGGTISAYYAIRFPSSVEKLILVAAKVTGLDDSATFNRFLEDRRSDPRYATAFETIASGFRPKEGDDDGFGRWFAGLLPYYLARPEKDLPSLQGIFQNARPQSWAYLQQKEADKMERGILESLDQIRAETLVIAGDQDAFCTKEQAVEAAHRLQGASLTILEDCGHFAWLERPETFLETVTGFLKS